VPILGRWGKDNFPPPNNLANLHPFNNLEILVPKKIYIELTSSKNWSYFSISGEKEASL